MNVVSATARSGQILAAARAGIVMVLLYNLLSATKEVVAGHIIQLIDPFALTCTSFFILAVIFNLSTFVQGREVYQKPFAAKSDLLWLNLTTLGAWLGFFYSVKFIEPAVVSAVMVGFGPAFMVIVSPLLYRRTRMGRVETLASLGILLATVYLIVLSSAGRSAIGDLTPLALLHGALSAAIGSVAIVGATVFAKRVSDIGASPSAIMAHRFYALVPAALVLALARGGFDQAFLTNIPVIIGLSIFGVLVPLWSLQGGIRRLPPSQVIIIISTAPAFTYVIQLLDDRLSPSIEVLPGIIIICLLAAIASVKKK